MRNAILCVLVVILCAGSATAQSIESSNEARRSSGTTKLWFGVGALALGTLVAAKASDTSSATSSLSTSQLWTGIAIAGTGGFLIWKGLEERTPARPRTTVGVSASRDSRGVFVHRNW